VVKVGPTNLEFDVVEYESFSCRLDEIESLNVDFYVEYELFSFDTITCHLFESSKPQFLESETFVPVTVDLDQILEHAKLKRLVALTPLMCSDISFMMIKFLG